MKKILVLTMVLVFALTATSFAAIDFSGEFETTLKWESDVNGDLYFEDGVLSSTASIEVSTDTEGEGWSLEADFGDIVDADASLGEYLLTLNDDYFTAYVWGNGFEHEDKATKFDFIVAGEEAADARVRVEVPVLDVADVTLDLDYGKTLYTFVDGYLADHSVGLAVETTLGDYSVTPEVEATNRIVGYGEVEFAPVTLDLAVGFDNVADDKNLLYGVGATVAATEEVTLTGSYTFEDENLADTTEFAAGIAFEEALLKATADYTNTDSGDETVVEARVDYRLNDAIDFGDLYDDYSDLTAAAFGLGVEQETTAAGTQYALDFDAAAPLFADVAYGKVGLGYQTGDSLALVVYEDANDVVLADAKTIFDVNLEAFINATSKLTLNPSADIQNFKDGGLAVDGSIITVGNVAEYKIGAGDTVLSFEVSQTTYDFLNLVDEKYAGFGVSVNF